MKKKIIGRRITEARRRIGISTNTLAAKVGKSQATISRIENGKQSISLQFLISISKALSIHPFYLLGPTAILDKNNGDIPGCFEQVIKAARIQSGYTSNTVARRLNRSKRYILDMESGLILPDEAELEKIAELYNLNLVLLIELYHIAIYSPLLSKHIAEATDLLSKCLEIFQSAGDNSSLNDTVNELNLISLPYYNTSSILSSKALNHVLLDITSNN